MRATSEHLAPGARSGALAQLFMAMLALVSLAAPAQPLPQAGAASATSTGPYGGTALDGQPFTLRLGDGRVRVLMFWRTDCTVCLSKMPELRANARGWREQPFDLVLINTDPRREDAMAYDRLRRDLSGGHGPLISAWAGDVRLPAAWNTGGRMPLTLVLDRQGRVAARHEGRVPAELWDQVADLLP
jgi:cytochrome oxidase Cu insertion factor (SCO1/SenC/PrrC family)